MYMRFERRTELGIAVKNTPSTLLINVGNGFHASTVKITRESCMLNKSSLTYKLSTRDENYSLPSVSPGRGDHLVSRAWFFARGSRRKLMSLRENLNPKFSGRQRKDTLGGFQRVQTVRAGE